MTRATVGQARIEGHHPGLGCEQGLGDCHWTKDCGV
jgi:hypothetical protein